MSISDRASLYARLQAGLAELGLAPGADACERLLDYVELLARWNAAYNLTAVREPGEMVTRHLLDSLAVAKLVRGDSLADLGTGAGLPGIPLAILALQGNTIWQMGTAEKLAVGKALAASGGASSIGLVAATVVVAPLVEELLYRGYLLGALRERLPGFAAVLVSALLFVFVLHFEPANLVAALCLGLATGWCALRSGSLLPGIIVHTASNAFGLWYLSLAAG